MLIEDEIPFLLHLHQVIKPLSLGILPAPSGLGDTRAVLGENGYEDQQAQRRQEKFLHWGCFNYSRVNLGKKEQ
jgi:hypothetical protein